MRSAEFQQKLKTNEERRDRVIAEGLAEVLQGATLTIGAQVGAQNRLHGEVTNQDVSQAIQDELGIEIDRHKIEIERPIRSLGIFMLPVRISKGLEASITVEILEESELAAREAAVAAEEAAERAAESEEAETDDEEADDAEQITDSDLDEPDEAPA
jgi:large subunit ribosomal protein L9